jgi:hypothetical protein
VRVATVFDKAGIRAGLFPEETATETFHVIEKLLVLG